MDLKLNLAHWSPVNLWLSELTTTTSIGPASPNLATVPRYNLQLVNDQLYYCAGVGVTPLLLLLQINRLASIHPSWLALAPFCPLWTLHDRLLFRLSPLHLLVLCGGGWAHPSGVESRIVLGLIPSWAWRGHQHVLCIHIVLYLWFLRQNSCISIYKFIITALDNI